MNFKPRVTKSQSESVENCISNVKSFIESEVVKEVTEIAAIAGRLKHFIHNWKEIILDQFIIQCLKGYKIPFHEIPKQTIPPKEPNWSSKELKIIKLGINKLLVKKAVEECI